MMQMMKRFDDRYNRLDTIPAFDRRTDRNGKTIGLSRAAYTMSVRRVIEKTSFARRQRI